jgi:hypothetical protein
MITIAQTTPDANTAWNVVVALFAIGSNAATILIARAALRKQQTEVTPQPLQVIEAHEYVKRPEFNEHVRANDEAFKQLRAERSEDLRHSNEGRRLVYEKMDEVRKELSDKIDEVPGHVITILKNTGAI